MKAYLILFADMPEFVVSSVKDAEKICEYNNAVDEEAVWHFSEINYLPFNPLTASPRPYEIVDGKPKLLPLNRYTYGISDTFSARYESKIYWRATATGAKIASKQKGANLCAE